MSLACSIRHGQVQTGLRCWRRCCAGLIQALSPSRTWLAWAGSTSRCCAPLVGWRAAAMRVRSKSLSLSAHVNVGFAAGWTHAIGQEQSMSSDRAGSGHLMILGFRKRLLPALESLGMRSIESPTTPRASLQRVDGQSHSSRPAHSGVTVERAGACSGRQGHAGRRCQAVSSRPDRHG